MTQNAHMVWQGPLHAVLRYEVQSLLLLFTQDSRFLPTPRLHSEQRQCPQYEHQGLRDVKFRLSQDREDRAHGACETA